MAVTTFNATVEVAKCLWGLLAEPISYICNPTKNLELLEHEMRLLMSRSVDIEKSARTEEEAQQSQHSNEVIDWLQKVQNLEAEYDRVVERRNSHKQSRCFVWSCHCNYLAKYKLGKKISQLCNDVRECQTAAKFPDPVNPFFPPPVREMPVGETVGLDSMLSEVWTWLQEEHVGIIGLWGMGGVGKTTLLQKINEEHRSNSHGFDVVRRIDVPKLVNLDTIREKLLKDLGIDEDVWCDKDEQGRALVLCKALSNRKFVLLIDDVWERLDVSKIGIPLPSPKNGSKIVFTTPSLGVCGQMNANKIIEVQCLSSQDALQLFRKNVGEDILKSHPEIPTFATQIVDKCKGLPLALVTIGRAMANTKTLRQWENALEVLSQCPSKFGEMVDVYNLLQHTYDRLDSTSQQCFLYCALFPKDSIINTYYLTDLWIGEGFTGDIANIYLKQAEGKLILESLKSACLLESGWDEEHVKMHEVIREMALWIAREHRKEENMIIEEEEGACISRWKQAKRVSLRGHRITKNHITNLQVCSKLETLLINETDLETLPDEFFNSMNILKVLDMSSNRQFAKLPARVGSLAKLQYLNLSGANIKVLPDEMKYLTSLLYLLLDDTRHLKNIPKEVISNLSSLKVFRKSGEKAYINEEGLVEGLECLDQLNELSLDVHTTSSVKRLLNSRNLQRSITVLNICDYSYFSTVNVPASSTESIDIYEDVLRPVSDRLSNVLEMTNLQVVTISGCDKLRCLSWLVYAPKLQEVNVKDGRLFEKIIDEDMLLHTKEKPNAKLFSSLKSLRLGILPNLMSIYNQSLSCPFLREIFVWVCPKLKKLPFDSYSGMNSLKVVKARLEWWSGLEWEDKATKAFFTSKLVELC